MKRILLFLLLAALAGLLTACGGRAEPAEPAGSAEVRVHSSGQYAENLDTVEDLMRYATNAVEAALLSREPFGAHLTAYRFETGRDLAGTMPDEFYMYGADDERYIAGHTYLLFLEGTDTALVPHTIYTTVRKDLIIDLTGSGETAPLRVGDPSGENGTSAADLEAAVTGAVENGTFGEALWELAPVSDSASLAGVAAEADVIAELRVSHEENANPCASTYSVELEALLKGPENAVAPCISLPPALDPGRTYYVFLKEEPANPGAYVLFSRVYPVLAATEEAAAALALALE